MPRRTPLPPPPPPVEIRTWPDRDAMLADRAAVLHDLTRRTLGTPKLLLFLLAVALLQLGWGCVGAGLVSMGPGVDPVSLVLLAVGGAIGIAILVPTALAVAFGVRRDRRMRELLCQWAALARTPARDAGLRRPVLSMAWLLVSFALGALGLWTSFATSATARPGSTTYGEVAYLIGAGTILWVMGLIGVVKAVSHYRWAIRLTVTSAPPANTAADAHR
ncbi:hypothetical protein [Streptomyces sp. FIT100]|uniref:hypothetical protein n=1 Tax=Streptomyces sp. FIT100 TaxID=2837956 RepID=UPI0021C829D3|nr:hypothetical protein [Streptomyces sp. FIT100]UUN28665.1 hypothetical protein KK483_21480 [Streptomyces sp. FIT100]